MGLVARRIANAGETYQGATSVRPNQMMRMLRKVDCYSQLSTLFYTSADKRTTDRTDFQYHHRVKWLAVCLREFCGGAKSWQ